MFMIYAEQKRFQLRVLKTNSLALLCCCIPQYHIQVGEIADTEFRVARISYCGQFGGNRIALVKPRGLYDPRESTGHFR
jgi:hypothetical protein